MGLLRAAKLLSAGPVRPDLQSAWGHVGFGGLARITAALPSPRTSAAVGRRGLSSAFLGPLSRSDSPQAVSSLPAHGSERKALAVAVSSGLRSSTSHVLILRR